MFEFSYGSEKMDEIEEQYEELSWDVSEIQDQIFELESEINEGTEELKQLNLRKKTINKKLKENKKELENLNNEFLNKKIKLEKYKSLYDEKYNRMKAIRLETFRQYILKIQPDNIYSCSLNYDTSTVKLLDEFCESKKEFLVLKRQFYLNYNYSASLIISKTYEKIEAERTRPTMTELKRNVGNFSQYISCDRLQPLLKEIDKIDRKNKMQK